MASVPAQQKPEDIASVVATLASRQSGRTGPAAAPLSGPKRAAIMMLALGEQYGSKVWSLLDDDEVRELSAVMSSLGTIEANVVEVPSDEPAGTVVAQNPVGGQAQQGSTVRLNVSRGR